MSDNIRNALIDIARWLYRGFFVPGDRLVSLLDSASPGSLQSGVLSAVVWLGAIASILMICRLIRDLDQMLTAFVVRMYEEVLRALRVIARRLSIAFRSYALDRQARLARTEVSELPALSALQLRVLQSHAGLPPAHLATPSEIASALDMRSADVEIVLGTLRKLRLVERALGAGDGEDGYRLTRAGEVLLAARSRAQQVKATPLAQRTLQSKRIEPRLGI